MKGGRLNGKASAVYMPKIPGSNPGPLISKPWHQWTGAWAEDLPCSSGIYLRRWFLETPFGSIRLHHWLKSDDRRAPHDHPWDFSTIVIWGGYSDVAESGERDCLRIGSIRFRRADHRHHVEPGSKGAWTLLLTGPKYRRWGFWTKQRFFKANRYFLENGAHPCD